MTEAKLEKEHQVFIVQSLACFERLVDVQEALKEFFEVEISLPAIKYYDIKNPQFPQKWKPLFTRTRNKFIKESAQIPISNKSYRLQKLQKMFDAEEQTKLPNKKAMREILEQAAKESGDSFSNKQKHELTGKDGAELKPQTITVNVVKSNSIIKNESDD